MRWHFPRLRLRPDVLRMALPVLTEQGFLVVMSLVSTLMASRLGMDAVSAIGMVEALSMLFTATFNAVATGGAVVVAHCWGRGDRCDAANAALHAIGAGVLLALTIVAALCFGGNWLLHVLYSAVEPHTAALAHAYFCIAWWSFPAMAMVSAGCGVLRGAGNTRLPMQVNLFMYGLHLAAGYVLMLGLPLPLRAEPLLTGFGVQGAAMAMVLARCCGALLVFRLLIGNASGLDLRHWRRTRFEWRLLRPIFSVGVPSGLESIFFHIGKLITQVMVAGLGSATIAANYIASSIVTLLNIPGQALSVPASTLVGHNAGRGDWREAENVIWDVFLLATVSLSVLAFCLLPVVPSIVGIYSHEARVTGMTADIVRLNCFFMPVWAASFVLPAALRGAGDARFTFKVAVFGMWFIRILAGYVLCVPCKMGVIGVWLGMYIDWSVRGALFLCRTRGNKWKTRRLLD